ncbi:MAG: riboflavin kinase, partial [Bacillota bacterium]|nr:riboflavin kinase [Bacillota bacterium]
MIVLKDNFTLKIDCQTYIALGSFDGIHLGHISLIKKIVELSKKNNVKSMVFTFNNHPLSIINPERAPKLLIRNEEKLELLEKNKVDIVNLANFNTDLMKITPEDFIKRMKECYNVKGFVAGFNYRFGYKNQGDVTLLKDICSKLNVETYIMDSVMHKDEVISSTRIRELLAEGDIITTNEMLTEPFFLCGIIIKGKQLGHKIGFPTVNL